jgi:hypothetical protein
VAQLGDQLLVEAAQRKGDVAVLERVGHPADAVVRLTSRYLPLICSRVVSFCAGKKSLMTLNTYGKLGRSKTSMTIPLMPGAMRNLSDEWRMCIRRSR